MLKNKSKMVVMISMILLLIVSTISCATDTPVTTSANENNTVSTVPGDNARNTEEPTTTSQPEQEIYNGDLYIFDNNITMDQLVDGNVFLFGSNIKVTGKVNGSLYALGNAITFEKDSYIVQSIYAFGNIITLNGSANDIYVLGNQVDMSYDSFAIRDLRVAAVTFNFNGGVGRNAFVSANHFNFITTDQKAAIVYGNLNYSSSNELSLSKEFVQGDITFTKEMYQEQTMPEIILDKMVSLCNTLLYSLVVFFLCLWLAPKFLEKASSYIHVKKGFMAFGIGLLACIITIFVAFALLFTIVGLPLSFMLSGVFILLLSLSTTVTAICISYKLKQIFKYSKNFMTYLTLAGVVIILWALSLIPYVRSIISFIITFFGFGVILHYLFTRNMKTKEDKGIQKETKKVSEKKFKKEDK